MISYQHAKGYTLIEIFKLKVLIIDKKIHWWHPIYKKEYRIGKYGIQFLK
jgi:hypothetical protein